MTNTLQYDNGGKPYFEYLDSKGNTQRTYVSPAAFGEDIGGNAETSWHSGPQWNAKEGTVENPFKWGKLITTATAAGLGAGALNAAGVLGGAGGGPTAGALDTVGYGTGSGYGGLATTGGVLGGSEAGLAGAPALGALAPDVISGGGISGVTSGGGGFLSGLVPKTATDLLGAAGSGLGAFSSGQAKNRGEQFYGQYLQELAQQARDKEYAAEMLAREQEGRAGQQDAWRKLQGAQHLLSPAPMPNVSPYGAPQRKATDAEQQGASALSAEVLKRLQNGNPLPMPVQRPIALDPSLLQQGKTEKSLGWLSPILNFLGKR